MEAISIEPKFDAVFRVIGDLVAETESGFRVATDQGDFVAQRATSCLLAPQVEDRVLLVGEPSGALYILAVLERSADSETRLSTAGNLILESESGKVAVQGQEGVDLRTSGRLGMIAGRLEARAATASFALGAVKLMGQSVDAVLGRVAQRVKTSIRSVEHMDQLRAGQVDYRAEGLMKVHGQNTIMTAEKLVKADGEQVHLG